MITTAFYWILNMSIAATLIGCMVMLLRKIRQIPRTVIYFLWILPFLRMILPFLPVLRPDMLRFYRLVPISGHSDFFAAGNFIQLVDDYKNGITLGEMVYKSSRLQTFLHYSALIYLIIGILLILYFIFTYFGALYSFRNTTHIRGRVYSSEKTKTAFVYGIFFPRVVLPKAMTSNELRYIAAHERVHIRRGDNIVRFIAILIACIHWFNPFSWFF